MPARPGMMEGTGPRRKVMKLMRLRRLDRLVETPVTLPGRGMKPPSVTESLVLFLCFCACYDGGMIAKLLTTQGLDTLNNGG